MASLPVRTPDAFARAVDTIRRRALHRRGLSNEEIDTLGERQIRELTDQRVDRLLEGFDLLARQTGAPPVSRLK